MKVKERAQEFEATQWHKDGDHKLVSRLPRAPSFGLILTKTGSLIVHPGDWVLESGNAVDVVSADEFERLYEVTA